MTLNNTFKAVSFGLFFLSILSCVSEEKRLETFWNGWNIASLQTFENISLTEEKFEEYVGLLNQVPVENALSDLNSFMDAAAEEPVAYTIWIEWFEASLHGLHAEYRNEILYNAIVKRVVEENIIDSNLLPHYLQLEKVASKNLEGQRVPSFLMFGERFNVRSTEIFKKETHLILLLDAGCSSCFDMVEEAVVDHSNDDYKIVAIFINGNTSLLNKMSERFGKKIQCFSISENDATDCAYFDLTMIPCKILVDKEGKIIRSYY